MVAVNPPIADPTYVAEPLRTLFLDINAIAVRAKRPP